MKHLSIKTFFVLPVLTLAIAPAAWAASIVSPATSAQSTQQVAQAQSICMATYDPEGVNFYLSPIDNSPLTRLPIDEIVTVDMISNNGDWAKVTDSYGTIGWIETQYLSCSDMGSEASDSDELDLDDLDLTLE